MSKKSMWKFVKTNQNNKILNQLVSDHCLSFGRSPKLNNKKITHYISGTRQKVDIFNLYEMRYLLLKVYPLIHNLFLQQRLNVRKKKTPFVNRSDHFKTTAQKLPKGLQSWKYFWRFHARFNKPLRGAIRPLVPKILFASTTELYSSIVSSAAYNCHMPFHVKRWLSGTISASSAYWDDFEQWSFLTNDFKKEIEIKVQKKFPKKKKNFWQQRKKIHKYQFGRKPSLIIIPDASNNEMIIKETQTFGIPVLGLVSSNCRTEIAYPIFANDLSIYSIHFFCHFLSSLITKELVKNKRKLYIARKRVMSIQFPQVIRDISKFNIRQSNFRKTKRKSKKKNYVFQGRYFLDSVVIPKVKIKKEIRFQKKRKKKNKQRNFKISAKKLIWLEDKKRLGKSSYLKKRILKKIHLLEKLHRYNFPKAIRKIRLPANKPKFRFWNQNKFFFSSALKFMKNTPVAFQFRRFRFPKSVRKLIKKIRFNTKKAKLKQKLRLFHNRKKTKKQLWTQISREQYFNRKYSEEMRKKCLTAIRSKKIHKFKDARKK